MIVLLNIDSMKLNCYIAWTSFTQEESDALRKEVKEIGLMKFMEKYLVDQQVPPLKLMEAFNVVMVCVYDQYPYIIG